MVRLIGMVLVQMRPSLLRPGGARHTKLVSWFAADGGQWLRGELTAQLGRLLGPRDDSYDPHSHCTPQEFARLWWCLHHHADAADHTSGGVQTANNRVLAPLVELMSTMYSRAYLAPHAAETALSIFVELVQFSFDSELSGPDNSPGGKTSPETPSLSARVRCTLAALFGPAMGEACAYMEMRLFEVDHAAFSHNSHLLLPIVVMGLRAALRLYCAGVRDIVLASDNSTRSAVRAVQAAGERTVRGAMAGVREPADPARAVVCMRNLDAVVDVLLPRHGGAANRDWVPSSSGQVPLRDLLDTVRRSTSSGLRRLAASAAATDTGVSPALLVATHMVHRWRCLGWTLHACDDSTVALLPVDDVRGLFEDAHDALDCAGKAFLEPVMLALGRLLPRYVDDVVVPAAVSEGQEAANGAAAAAAAAAQAVTDTVGPVIRHAWSAVSEIVQRSGNLVGRYDAFMALAFHRKLMSFPALNRDGTDGAAGGQDVGMLKQTFHTVLAYRNRLDPLILQRLAVQCFRAWRCGEGACWDLALPYVGLLCDTLLLYHEPEAKHLHDAEREHAGPPPSALVRVVVLSFLSHMAE